MWSHVKNALASAQENTKTCIRIEWQRLQFGPGKRWNDSSIITNGHLYCGIVAAVWFLGRWLCRDSGNPLVLFKATQLLDWRRSYWIGFATNLDLLPSDPFNRFVRNYIRAKSSSSKRNILLTGLSRLDELALESHLDFLFQAAEDWYTASWLA